MVPSTAVLLRDGSFALALFGSNEKRSNCRPSSPPVAKVSLGNKS